MGGGVRKSVKECKANIYPTIYVVIYSEKIQRRPHNELGMRQKCISPTWQTNELEVKPKYTC